MRLSICMMVKNEEKYLESCLKSIQSLCEAVESELIIVDTGSTDNTVQIAKKFTDKVYFHTWNNDFSAMRNTTIGYAIGEWILIVDADETLEVHQPLVEFLHSPERRQYVTVAISCRNIINLDTKDYTSLVSFRLFRNDGYFHYEGSVHNQPVFKGESLALKEVYLLHYGYVPSDKELMERKFLRTSEILKKELEKDAKNIYYWTQLSVTYGMHNNYAEAIEYAEKAYSLLPEKKTAAHMFVLLQMIIVYQHEEKYERVAEVSRESLAIKEGYLDVYYYYAESQASLNNYPEAIKYYEKYLYLLEKCTQQKEQDVSIIEYSVGFRQMAYFNLSRMLKKEGEYDKALYYAEKISEPKFVNDNLTNIIELYVHKEKFLELRSYYEARMKNNEENVFFDQLVLKMEQAGPAIKLEIAKVFCKIGSEFGLLCKIILEDHDGGISLESQEAAAKIKMEDMPVFCSDILYYLLKWHCPLEDLLTNIKEIWLSCVYDCIAKRHEDLCDLLFSNLQKRCHSMNFNDYKINKMLARYALLLNRLDDTQYMDIFTRYLQEGIAYMQAVYSRYVIDNRLVYEMKNDEEVFLLYMYHAEIIKETNMSEYAKYLRMALQAFPGMSRGIDVLLQELQNISVVQKNEFDEYKIQVKATIRQLIETNKMDEAKAILSEYKTIVPNDIEAILLESKILLN